MNIEYFEDYEILCTAASDLIYKELQDKTDLILCAASGASPTGVYRNLVTKFQNNHSVFSGLRIVKLDEWGGIPLNDPNSCETYLKTELIDPLEIEPEHYISFNSEPINKDLECARIAGWIKDSGPIDCCVLGLGLNGHIAFNEPAHQLNPFCHVTELSHTSLEHPMSKGMKVTPSFGLSLGLAEILQSRKIILLITGSNKYQIFKQILSAKISTYLPASLLWLHPNATCLVDKTLGIPISPIRDFC
jgi:galactosamine-6-phosphate isomerase